jgi:hypothetical protein
VSVSTKTATTLEDVIGCAGHHGEKKTQAQMDAGIVEEAKQQAAAWSR